MRNLADVVCGGLDLCIQRGGTTKIRLHPAMATLVYPSLCAVCTEHLAYFCCQFRQNCGNINTRPMRNLKGMCAPPGPRGVCMQIHHNQDKPHRPCWFTRIIYPRYFETYEGGSIFSLPLKLSVSKLVMLDGVCECFKLGNFGG